jgi:multidrug efflux pump
LVDEKQFEEIVIRNEPDGSFIRLKDIARVELGTLDDRNFFRGNGVPQIGLGIVRQSTANLLDVARHAGLAVGRRRPRARRSARRLALSASAAASRR